MSKYFLVTIEEMSSQTYKVKADDIEEAEKKVEAAYENGNVAFYNTEINTVGRNVRDENLNYYEELE